MLRAFDLDSWTGRIVAFGFVSWVVAVAWMLATLLVPRPFLPFFVVVVLIALMLPGIVTFVRDQDTSLEWSRAEKAAALALLLLAGSGIAPLWRGVPEHHQGKLVANDHGNFTRVSVGEFERLRLAEQRLFLAIPAFIFLVGAVYSRETWGRVRP